MLSCLAYISAISALLTILFFILSLLARAPVVAGSGLFLIVQQVLALLKNRKCGNPLTGSQFHIGHTSHFRNTVKFSL